MESLKRSLSWGLAALCTLTLVQCSNAPRRPPIYSASLPAGTEATVNSDANGVVTAAYDPNSATTQLVSASADSNISDVSVAFPPGSLAVANNITLKEGATIESDVLTGELSLSSTTVSQRGGAVEIAPSTPVDLLKPMTIALPLPTGLSLTSVSEDTRARLGVVYRIQVQATGENFVGFVPASDLTFDKANHVLYPSKYFGWFQVVLFDKVVARTQLAATLPLHIGVDVILTGTTIPSCGKADLGRTIYVEELKQFQYCSASGWTVIDLTGPQGSAGATGATGPTGATGAAGPTTYVYDSTPTKLGILLGLTNSSAILQIGTSTDNNLGFLGVDVATAAPNPLCATNATCSGELYYKTSSCTGQPFFKTKPMPKAILVSGAAYLRASGSESPASGTFLARLNTSGCVTSSFGTFSAYSVDTSYSLPSGQPAPSTFVAPLYIGL